MFASSSGLGRATRRGQSARFCEPSPRVRNPNEKRGGNDADDSRCFERATEGACQAAGVHLQHVLSAAARSGLSLEPVTAAAYTRVARIVVHLVLALSQECSASCRSYERFAIHLTPGRPDASTNSPNMQFMSLLVLCR